MIGPANVAGGISAGSLWYNALPTYVGKKSYYDMLVDDAQGRQPLPASGTNNVIVCPSAGRPATLSNKDTISPDGQYFLLNANDPNGVLGSGNIKVKNYMSYVYNSMPFGAPAPSAQNPNPTAVSSVKLTMYHPGNLVPVVVEKLVAFGEYQDKDVQRLAKAYPSSTGKNITAQGYTNNIAQPKSNWKRFTTRHNGGGNILFADGHVQWFKWGETQWQNPVEPAPTFYDVNQPNTMIWEPFGPIN